jgi:hypothetical protein
VLASFFAIQQAGSEEKRGYGEGESSVGPVAVAEADAGVDDPGATADKPDPGQVSHGVLDASTRRKTQIN